MKGLFTRYQQGDPRALARALTLVEADLPSASSLVRRARQSGRRAVVVGITGSPGSGKSTLTDGLITLLRAEDRRVAVLAVDPSSPYSGGAILGDRIRLLRHHADPGVFVRSLASRGALGGLSARTMPVLALLEGFGFDWIFVETVGVGQSEVDIAAVCDHTVLVLTPAGGDGVQAFKAGIMEIADVIAVNKSDLPGAERTVRELMAAQGLAPHDAHRWVAPVRRVQANTASGLESLLKAIADHRTFLDEAGLAQRREHRAEYEVRTFLQERLRQLLEAQAASLYASIASGELDPAQAAELLLEQSLSHLP